MKFTANIDSPILRYVVIECPGSGKAEIWSNRATWKVEWTCRRQFRSGMIGFGRALAQLHPVRVPGRRVRCLDPES